MITINEINAWRIAHGQSAIRLVDDPETGVRGQPRLIAELESALAEFEKSPKRQGNRDHLFMLLNGTLSRAHALEIAYGK